VTAGRARSPRVFGFDRSLSQNERTTPSPRALQETDWVTFASFSRMECMCEPSSSHLGVLWSGVLGRVLAPIRREQDRYWAKDFLRQCIHYATFATHGDLKRSRLNVVNAATRNGARSAFSHGSLTVIKWILCRYRETVFLPEAWHETGVAPSGDEWGGWWMGDALNATGVKKPP
jgi:hypothetical protein